VLFVENLVGVWLEGAGQLLPAASGMGVLFLTNGKKKEKKRKKKE